MFHYTLPDGKSYCCPAASCTCGAPGYSFASEATSHFQTYLGQLLTRAHGESAIGVYEISSPSGKLYVGMTGTSFTQRWVEHAKMLRLGAHKCKGLQRAYYKYGADGLTYRIVWAFERVPERRTEQDALLLTLEAQYWDAVRAEGRLTYNARPSGRGGVLHLEETRAAIRAGVTRAHGKSQKVFSREEMENLRNVERLTDEEIATRFNMALATVSKQRRELGFGKITAAYAVRPPATSNGQGTDGEARQKKGRAPRRVRRTPEVDPAIKVRNDTICRLYEDGMGLRQVGDSVGVSHITVRKILLSFGIPLRDTSFRTQETLQAQEEWQRARKAQLDARSCVVCGASVTSKKPEVKTCSYGCRSYLGRMIQLGRAE